MAKPSWHGDKEFDVEPIISFKNESVHFITFLDEGTKSHSEVPTGNTDKDGNPVMKKVPSIKFTVNENGEEKTYTPIAKAVINELEGLYPLENRTFRIELIRGRTPVDNIYKINEVE